MRVLGVSGSLRRCSYNRALLAAAAVACPRDFEFVVWRGLADIPPFDEDIRETPAAVALFRSELTRSDAVLFATPEYNGSVPGALKNALDWVSRPFATNALREKPVAVIGASQGLYGAVWAQAELRRILRTIGARVDDRELPVPLAGEAFDDELLLRDPKLTAMLGAIVCDLVPLDGRRAA
jgi:chromate reductase, NAD(P)H dehydrogenase (quinone)